MVRDCEWLKRIADEDGMISNTTEIVTKTKQKGVNHIII
jgi:hypothetical protein